MRNIKGCAITKREKRGKYVSDAKSITHLEKTPPLTTPKNPLGKYPAKIYWTPQVKPLGKTSDAVEPHRKSIVKPPRKFARAPFL